ADPRARADIGRAAARLEMFVGGPVRVAYATARPRIEDVAAGCAVASWFLAPGLFHRLAAASGAAVVAEPLGAHPRVADLIVRRYRTGITRVERHF
ncbi:MAG: sirohydrochlorin chelatase, partial [Actinophytocola sp.]|uniref:sirohydrochlorin chelatase n=1 Tax=Actinophytocola sp. TaxID=1872138 RepID=UPI003D6B994A